MEFVIDTSGFDDQTTEDLYNVFLFMQDDENGDERFEIESILLGEDIDAWEHIRALRLYNFIDEAAFSDVAEVLERLQISYVDY